MPQADSKRLQTEERLAIIETEMRYIKDSILHIETNLREITDNHLGHVKQEIDELRDQTRTMREFCAKMQAIKKYGLKGRDKAIVWGSLITAIGVVCVEIIRVLL